ncbi:hypothetical protein K402DRAFT_403132 [Aulographum hederae CBS 113979]|uniref:Uncharacterized protein n=1 Tax=Aulographum hederae CBS 113979 TaxID=1176131 RepID=A0A6G1H442_9PEZI|nr:hypothetical protein K402DRAFT_403132 [Aulographum hederae CBS 113979]
MFNIKSITLASVLVAGSMARQLAPGVSINAMSTGLSNVSVSDIEDRTYHAVKGKLKPYDGFGCVGEKHTRRHIHEGTCKNLDRHPFLSFDFEMAGDALHGRNCSFTVWTAKNCAGLSSTYPDVTKLQGSCSEPFHIPGMAPRSGISARMDCEYPAEMQEVKVFELTTLPPVTTVVTHTTAIPVSSIAARSVAAAADYIGSDGRALVDSFQAVVDAFRSNNGGYIVSALQGYTETSDRIYKEYSYNMQTFRYAGNVGEKYFEKMKDLVHEWKKFFDDRE